MTYPKAHLWKWCQGWSRTPATVLKAFIDAGLCSDQEPSREELRLFSAGPNPVACYAAYTKAQNDALPSEKRLNLDGVDWPTWYDKEAASPLTGTTFNATWIAVASVGMAVSRSFLIDAHNNGDSA